MGIMLETKKQVKSGRMKPLLKVSNFNSNFVSLFDIMKFGKLGNEAVGLFLAAFIFHNIH